MNRNACVIGAGIGGLALAIRLQSAGLATTVVEARDQPGGMAYPIERDGFRFDLAPSLITDPTTLRELWQLAGHEMADDVELLPVAPFCRFNWPDGTSFDYDGDDAALRAQIARIAPADIDGYDQLLRYATNIWQGGYAKLSSEPFLKPIGMVKAAPALLRYQPWRSVWSIVAHFVKSEKLREAFSVPTLRIGANPFTASALHTALHKLERQGGVWWAKGGTSALVAGMVRHFQRIGGTLRTGDPVTRIHTIGNRVTEVECAGGWRERFDCIASNADVVHSYRDLLSENPAAHDYGRKLARKRFSPSAFVVHFGIDGNWPGVPHHMVLFGPRYRGFLEDVFGHGVLPRDFFIRLLHPTVTDPSVAPAGKSSFSAMIPVAHMGKLTVDWEQVGPLIANRILDEVGRRLIPDIHDRILTSFHYAPRDFALDLNSHLGSGHSLEPANSQSAWLRPHNRDRLLTNFYLVGSGTHPGAGIPEVVAGARATATLMLEDTKP